jgi:hypothetical protein
MKILFLSMLLGGSVSLSLDGCRATSSADATAAATTATAGEVFPEVDLRGYGRVSGQQTSLTGGASLLTIQCESSAKAELLQAKYLSDLSLLPKTQTAQVALGGAGETVPARQAENQGYILAARKGTEVRILAASELTSLEAALAGKEWAAWSFTTDATVPMFLDRWDRWGFRAYYRAWASPPDGYAPAKEEGGYDILKEFQFAEDMERTGILTQTTSHQMDTAGGLNNDVWWDWIVPQTQAHGLPLGLNIKVAEGSEATWLTNRFRDQMMQPMPQFGGTYFKTGTPYYGLRGTASWSAKEANQI